MDTMSGSSKGSPWLSSQDPDEILPRWGDGGGSAGFRAVVTRAAHQEGCEICMRESWPAVTGAVTRGSW